MSRLIDADALIEAINEQVKGWGKSGIVPSLFSAIAIIQNQPTAYDLDKVVAELENHRDCYEKVIGQVIVNNYDINLERTDLMNHAIEIVRKGGVECTK